MTPLDTTRVWTDTTSEPMAHFAVAPTGGVEVRPGRFQGDDGATLPAEDFDRFRAIARDATAVLDRGRKLELEVLIETLADAMELFPAPELQWTAFGWLLAHIGEASWRLAYLSDDAEERSRILGQAHHTFSKAIGAPGGLGNPWVHLRLGQLQLMRGDQQRAADELARAYMGGGREIFASEAPQYFAFVERVLQPRDGPERLP